MNTTQSLDMQLTKLGFWSAVTLIVTGVLSTFLPLDIPAGVSAEHTERIAWLSVNSGVFIAGWLVQIAAMAALTGLFFAMAWQISKQYPLRGILGAMVILTSFVAFIIPKFIAIWSIPLQTSAAKAHPTPPRTTQHQPYPCKPDSTGPKCHLPTPTIPLFRKSS